jgi:hypothetical protein
MASALIEGGRSQIFFNTKYIALGEYQRRIMQHWQISKEKIEKI